VVDDVGRLYKGTVEQLESEEYGRTIVRPSIFRSVDLYPAGLYVPNVSVDGIDVDLILFL
jgi:hypothetical protein